MKLNRILPLLLSSSTLVAFDNHHFYRASNFFHEPRLEKEWLSTVEVTAAGGSTNHGRNNDGETVSLFNIYGPNNLRLLGSGLADLDPSNPQDLALINLANTQANGKFGIASYSGKFKLIESYINYYQNFQKGFFTFINVPIRSLYIKPKRLDDCSPSNHDSCPNRYSPEWQNFLAQFDAILERYCISTACTKETGVGDVSAYLGWTKNFTQTEHLDFVDATFKAGVITPTGKARSENNPFSIPLGYNKHWGVSIVSDASFGVYDWLTFGAHGGVIVFVSRTQNVRMKTDACQSGIIKLAKGCAKVEQGSLWDVGGYMKADHLGQGLSFLFGYTYANKSKDTLCPTNTKFFDPMIVNTDAQYQGWDMHTIHLLVEYDFTREGMRFGPRIGFIFNANVGGKRNFKTDMVGGYGGLEIAWQL